MDPLLAYNTPKRIGEGSIPNKPTIPPRNIPTAQKQQPLNPHPQLSHKKSFEPPSKVSLGTKSDVPVEIDASVAASVAKKAYQSGAFSELAKDSKIARNPDGTVGVQINPTSAYNASKIMVASGAAEELASGISIKPKDGVQVLPRPTAQTRPPMPIPNSLKGPTVSRFASPSPSEVSENANLAGGFRPPPTEVGGNALNSGGFRPPPVLPTKFQHLRVHEEPLLDKSAPQNSISNVSSFVPQIAEPSPAIKQKNVVRLIAIADFETEELTDLNFKRGQLIILSREIDENW